MSNPYRKALDSHQDFPEDGVTYWDVTPLLQDPDLVRSAVAEILAHFASQDKEFDCVAAIEAKGFTIGSCLAYKLQKPLVLIRKPGLLPGETNNVQFRKEYGQGEYQLQDRDVQGGDRILLFYDILAGPGATRAGIELLEQAGGHVKGCAYITELEYLNGREQLSAYDLFSLVTLSREDCRS